MPIEKKIIKTNHFNFDNRDYNQMFDEIKQENKERFKRLKDLKAEELAQLIQSNSLGHEHIRE